VANAALYLEEHPEVAQRLEQAIREQAGLTKKAPPKEDEKSAGEPKGKRGK
jgi:hypothetical protein